MQNNSSLAAALSYLKQGIPVVASDPKSKRPYFKWSELQNKLPTESQVKAMWQKYPSAMVSIVTGRLSGIMVVDCDSPEAIEMVESNLPDQCDPIIAVSPRGGRHYYFSCSDDNWKTKAAVLKNIDVRASGGVIVSPPSHNDTGGQYRWLNCIEFDKNKLHPMPVDLCNLLNSANERPKRIIEFDLAMFEYGRRDGDLFHVANVMQKGGAKTGEIAEVLKRLILSWGEKSDEKWIKDKIDSALNREEKSERNLTEEITLWLEEHPGEIILNDLYRDLNLVDKTPKATARKVLSRLAKDNKLSPDKRKSGCYHKINEITDKLDWENADLTEVPISYPLGIEKQFVTLRKTIVVIAGVSDAGKSAFLMHFAALNIDKGFNVKYFSSEMGAEELRFRIERSSIPKEIWKQVDFRERFDNFADCIDPNAINIIDYIEVFENAFMIGKQIKDVFDKLQKGIAIIAIQKDPNKNQGVGGMYSMHKSRLYLNIDYETLQIKKAKNKRYMETLLRDQKIKFSINKGLLQATSEWHK